MPAHHEFKKMPPGFLPGMGIPIYMECACGLRWYTDRINRPNGYCATVTAQKAVLSFDNVGKMRNVRGSDNNG